MKLTKAERDLLIRLCMDYGDNPRAVGLNLLFGPGKRPSGRVLRSLERRGLAAITQWDLGRFAKPTLAGVKLYLSWTEMPVTTFSCGKDSVTLADAIGTLAAMGRRIRAKKAGRVKATRAEAMRRRKYGGLL